MLNIYRQEVWICISQMEVERKRIKVAEGDILKNRIFLKKKNYTAKSFVCVCLCLCTQLISSFHPLSDLLTP